MTDLDAPGHPLRAKDVEALISTRVDGKPAPAFWSRYVGECWVVVSPEWLDATGRSPEGLDVAAMNEAFTELTGQPGPFPVSPAPAPQPSPAPAPAPVVDAADRALAAAVTPWAAKPHNAAGANVAKAFTAWKAAKGL